MTGITFITNIARVAQRTWVFVVGFVFFINGNLALANQTVWAQSATFFPYVVVSQPLPTSIQPTAAAQALRDPAVFSEGGRWKDAGGWCLKPPTS